MKSDGTTLHQMKIRLALPLTIKTGPIDKSITCGFIWFSNFSSLTKNFFDCYSDNYSSVSGPSIPLRVSFASVVGFREGIRAKGDARECLDALNRTKVACIVKRMCSFRCACYGYRYEQCCGRGRAVRNILIKGLQMLYILHESREPIYYSFFGCMLQTKGRQKVEEMSLGSKQVVWVVKKYCLWNRKAYRHIRGQG
jgi:hypothetical protein